MFGNYTQATNDRCFQLIDDDIYKIWDAIESLSEDETAKRWKEKLVSIAQEYSFSSRFALMRILFSRLKKCPLNEAQSDEEFVLQTEKESYTFAELSMEYAENLPRNELEQYGVLLNDLASQQEGEDESVSRYLIAKALRDPEEAFEAAMNDMSKETDHKTIVRIKKECRTLLTRKEALRLGHVLRFSLEEMSWFLLRTFDFEEGFRYYVSGDLIEAYGFKTGASWQKVEELKAKYVEQTKNLVKADVEGRAADWTQKTGDSLMELIGQWSEEPKERENRFMEWLLERAAYLDLPSRTAVRIYRRLAVYIYEISAEIQDTPDRETFVRTVKAICQGEHFFDDRVERYLYEGDVVSKKKSKIIEAELLEKNKNLFTSASDRAKAWRTVSSDEKGVPCLIMAGRPDASRSRVQELLTGTQRVEKGDMLHLLWYGFNLCWEANPIFANMSDLQWNLADFTETAQEVLDAALLPAFYPPHMMEQSMMLSIVISAEEGGVPADNYAVLCETLIKPRNRKK